MKSWCIEEIRSVNRFVWTQRVSTVNIHRHLVEVLGDAVMRLHLVRIWCTQLQNGRTFMAVIAVIKNVYDYCTSEGNDFQNRRVIREVPHFAMRKWKWLSTHGCERKTRISAAVEYLNSCHGGTDASLLRELC